jgi:hypothetical protein
MDPVLASIDEALARTGMSDAAASKLAVGNYSLIKNMRAARGDDKRYTYQSLAQLARVLGLECYFGPKRALSGFSEGEVASIHSKNDASLSGFLPIPWHAFSGQKGTASMAFSQAWLASNGLIPDFLQAIVPNFCDSSLTGAKNTVALLQTNAPRKGTGAIWCYRDGLTIGISRAGFVDGAAVIVPSTEASQELVIPKEATPGVGLLGKVVWLGMLT